MLEVSEALSVDEVSDAEDSALDELVAEVEVLSDVLDSVLDAEADSVLDSVSEVAVLDSASKEEEAEPPALLTISLTHAPADSE